MPITDSSRFWVSQTPQDAAITQDLTDFFTHARPNLGLYAATYGTTLPEFYDGMRAATQRGCVTRAIFDHSQGVGAAEAKVLLPFLDEMGHDNFLIGTSPKNNIVHDKKLLANVPQDPKGSAAQALAASNPDAFTDWREALDAGYPVAWFGSWNFSASATSQVNTVAIIPSIPLVEYFGDLFMQNFAWIQQHDQKWNTLRPQLLAVALGEPWPSA